LVFFSQRSSVTLHLISSFFTVQVLFPFSCARVHFWMPDVCLLSETFLAILPEQKNFFISGASCRPCTQPQKGVSVSPPVRGIFWKWHAGASEPLVGFFIVPFFADCPPSRLGMDSCDPPVSPVSGPPRIYSFLPDVPPSVPLSNWDGSSVGASPHMLSFL